MVSLRSHCPSGHPLTRRTHGAFYCNVCMNHSHPHEQAMQCVSCDYDKCVVCFSHGMSATCPNQHVLTKNITPSPGFYCNQCGASFDAGTVLAACRPCNYDICQNCIFSHNTTSSSTPPAPPSASSQPTFNTKVVNTFGFPQPTNVAASLTATKAALDQTAAKSGYRCVPVSWEDAQRGTVGGAISYWGGNISDVRLWKKDGTQLYTLRSQNWNERLGYVASKDVAVVVGNHARGGSSPVPITLQNYLKHFKLYAGYAGATSEQLWEETVDNVLSIRFQAVFLPIADNSTDPTPTEFCTEVYNYNTRDDNDPRNTILLCTAQGTNVQQDGSGAKKVFLHNVDANDNIHRYWLEAERSAHKVGGAQHETDTEAAAAAARGKATAIHIGTKAMGTRFNVQMLIQLPCKQKPRAQTHSGFGSQNAFGSVCFGTTVPTAFAAFGSSPAPAQGGFGAMGGFGSSKASVSVFGSTNPTSSAPAFGQASQALSAGGFVAKPQCFVGTGAYRFGNPGVPSPAPVVGTSNAARVSRGTQHDVWPGLAQKAPVRDPAQHGTITVTLYYTVAGGVPSVADVEACVADLDAMYKACPSDKRLVDCAEVTKELTVKDSMDIQSKVASQPFAQQTVGFPWRSTFPTD